MKKLFTLIIIAMHSLPSFAQQQGIFIQVDGIEGESTDAAHKKWIDATAFSGGASYSSSFQGGGGSGAGKVNVQDYVFSVCLDNASNRLKAKVHNGTRISFVNVEFAKLSGGQGANSIYAKIRMENVVITGFSEGATNLDGKTLINITFNFQRYRNTYLPVNTDGTPGQEVVFGWDIVRNIAW